MVIVLECFSPGKRGIGTIFLYAVQIFGQKVGKAPPFRVSLIELYKKKAMGVFHFVEPSISYKWY